MAGVFYEKLPKGLSRDVNKYFPNGVRLRIAPEFSGHNPNYREDRNKQICEKRNEGLSLREISEEFNLSKRYVQNILKENGMAGISERENESRVERIKMALKVNMSVMKIAKKEGISRERVYQILRKEGLG